ncbi:MAG: YhcH/YjgK/YiaL family protein [Muribaculaceae bacterium]|nr:YhcH/YjgK/YiaL family protein [Muribaculaceae bacterium]
MAAMAEGVYTRQCDDKAKVELATGWMASGAWRNGFEKAFPHEAVNAIDFYEQYSKNKEQWNAMFRWLEETDLLAIPGGKHPIEGTSLVVSVEDSKNGPLEKRQSESHRKKIDFQYAVKGTERFGIIDHETSTPNCEYKPDVIHYDYDQSKAKFYDSTPDKFFLFFPEDWHIAKINNDTDDQDIRVIVVKIDYIE